jgi:hypothetical protein
LRRKALPKFYFHILSFFLPPSRLQRWSNRRFPKNHEKPSKSIESDLIRVPLYLSQKITAQLYQQAEQALQRGAEVEIGRSMSGGAD